MAISERLGNFRQLLPGARAPQEDERLLQLYWNRAELKKELSRLQDECHHLREQLKKQESATARANEQLQALELHLGDPDVAMHAVIYFQLHRLWRTCAGKVARFSRQLQHQQEDRERRRQLIDFDQGKRAQLAECEQRLDEARAAVEALDAKIKIAEANLEALRGFWNYFRRRRLLEELASLRQRWDEAATLVTDLSDERDAVESAPPPVFEGLSIEGRRGVNTAVIAYAQQLVAMLSKGGLALLAKETTTRRVFDVRYGGRDECGRLMVLLREAHAAMTSDKDDLADLKRRIDRVRATANYRSDADTVPLTDSIGILAAPAAPVAGLETGHRAGINVLVDDYWDVYQALL